MNNYMRMYPAIGRRFSELGALYKVSTADANRIRAEAYQSLYDNLSNEEKVFADRKCEELMAMMSGQHLGKQGAWELLVALSQAMEWANWPERIGEND